MGADAKFQEARSLFLSGDFYAAFEACEQILRARGDHGPTLHLVGLLCYRAGDVPNAILYFRRSLEVLPDYAEAHFNLGLMLKNQGRLQEALAAYEAGLALDPDNAQARYNIALAYRQDGRLAEAAQAVRRALAADVALPNAFNLLGLIELESGRPQEAVRAFRLAIATHPKEAAPYRNLAEMLRHQDRPAEAAAVLEDWLKIDPADAAVWESLGALRLRVHRYEAALAALKEAVRLDALRADAHMLIHTAAQVLGLRDLALDHQAQALATTRLFSETTGRQGRPRLLILKAAGDWQANLPTDFLINREDWSAIHQYFITAEDRGPPAELPPCDLVFNAVAEPDRTLAELDIAARTVAALGLPCINHPDQIRQTSRDRVADRLKDLPFCLVPPTRRLAGSAALAHLDLPFPLLLRPVGTHAGEGMIKVDDEAGLAAAGLAGGEFYATRFIDYRSGDGLYRKYRVVLVDGVPYPFHAALSRRWMVHYYNAEPDDPARMDREEEQFLGDFDSVFPPPLRDSLTLMAHRLGLDFVGVDCAIMPDGRLLLFEVDAGVLIHLLDDPVRHAYKHRHVPRIFEATARMLLSRLTPPA